MERTKKKVEKAEKSLDKNEDIWNEVSTMDDAFTECYDKYERLCDDLRDENKKCFLEIDAHMDDLQDVMDKVRKLLSWMNETTM
jgi:hypothetical protein